jgi:large subunit ribosomal protein L25
MATVSLAASPREGTGKGVARKLRAAERVPAILYGAGSDPFTFSVSAPELRKALGTKSGARAVIKLDIEGESEPRVAIVKEIQRHPVSRNIIHVDLITIDLKVPIEVSVPVAAKGTPIGVRLEGGVLGWARREVSIRVLPTAIPEEIEIDISGLHVNDAIHMSDLKDVEGYEVLDDDHLTICSVASTKLEIESDEESEDGAEAGEDAAEGAAEGGDEAGGDE